jgi:uncharacterized protein (DUF2267 family)
LICLWRADGVRRWPEGSGVVRRDECFETALDETHVWLTELVWEGRFEHEQQAFVVLRTVLHCLRDRLEAMGAARLGAELPILIRGCYYEGWLPADERPRRRRADNLVESVRRRLNGEQRVDVAQSVRAVLQLLCRKVSCDALHDSLPPDVKAIWPRIAERIDGRS